MKKEIQHPYFSSLAFIAVAMLIYYVYLDISTPPKIALTMRDYIMTMIPITLFIIGVRSTNLILQNVSLQLKESKRQTELLEELLKSGITKSEKKGKEVKKKSK